MKSKTNEVVKKLRELNTIIKSLDPSIRPQSFELLRPVFFSDEPEHERDQRDQQTETAGKSTGTHNKEKFFGSFDHKKPSDNVFLIAAWLYSQHGVFPLTSDTIKAVADETGVTVPGRPDMTLKAAQKKAKHLFSKQGAGYKPTVHGETFLKDTYRVKKGNSPIPKEPEN